MNSGFDKDQLFYTQWSTLGIVSNEHLYISPSAPKVTSMRDMDPLNVLSYGEFDYFVKYIENKKDVA